MTAAEVEPATLAEGIIHEPEVLPHFLALQSADGAGLCGKVLLQKLSEVSLADEADARRVLLFGGRKTVFLGDAAHVRLLEISEREEHALKLLLRELI